MIPPIEKNLALLRCAAIINEALHEIGIDHQISPAQLGASDKTIYEVPRFSARISDLINDSLFPSIGDLEASHYTSLKASLDILSSKFLRLYAVRKRIDEGELTTFLNATGYGKALRDSVYKELSDALFYASFSEEKHSGRLWKIFGDGSKGVRIDFRIQARVPDLRRVLYKRASLDPIISMLNRIRIECKREFLLRRISKLCAFHLPTVCRTEAEIRMLVSRFSDQYDGGLKVEQDERGRYISVPIDDLGQTAYSIQLSRIQPGPKCPTDQLKRLKEVARQNGFEELVSPVSSGSARP